MGVAYYQDVDQDAPLAVGKQYRMVLTLGCAYNDFTVAAIKDAIGFQASVTGNFRIGQWEVFPPDPPTLDTPAAPQWTMIYTFTVPSSGADVTQAGLDPKIVFLAIAGVVGAIVGALLLLHKQIQVGIEDVGGAVADAAHKVVDQTGGIVTALAILAIVFLFLLKG